MISFNRHRPLFGLSLSKWGRLLSILRRCRQTPANIGYRLWHTDCTFYILSYLCWRALGCKNAGPRWSQELFVLSEFLHGTVWQTWEPVTQMWHCGHQSTSTIRLVEKFLLQSQSKPILVKYVVGPIQIRDTGTRQLPVRPRFVLLWELLAWLSYQPFDFPKQLLVPSALHDSYSLRGPYSF
jgi:hypothetical protein